MLTGHCGGLPGGGGNGPPPPAIRLGAGRNKDTMRPTSHLPPKLFYKLWVALLHLLCKLLARLVNIGEIKAGNQ